MESGSKTNTRSQQSGKKGGKPEKPLTDEEAARRKEALRETLRKKSELEQNAHRVVEHLVENSVTGEFLVDCAKYITLSNYKDTIEERSIVKLCGYPVCPNKLLNVPKQQYKISTKSNKVYDITERKFFCSNFCYSASKHFEVQISNTPLWLRDKERPAEITLLAEGESGHSGVEVQIATRPVTKAEIENPAPVEVVEPVEPAEPASHKKSGCESDGSDPEQDFVSSVVTSGIKKVKWWNRHTGGNKKKVTFVQQPKAYGTRKESKRKRGTRTRDNEAHALTEKCTISEDTQETSHNITQVGMSKKGVAGLRNVLDTLAPASDVNPKELPSAVQTGLLAGLCRALQQWRTEETLRFLYGPDYQPLSDKAKQMVEREELDEDDIEECAEKLPEKDISIKEAVSASDYEHLQKEMGLLNLKVQEFYKGSFVLPEEDEEKAVKTDDTEGADHNPMLPLVDSKSQHLIQKRIVVEKLNRSLQNIVGPLKLTMNDVSGDINNLVKTFRFTNTNIIHKPPQWTLIAIVLLFVLCEVSPLIRESLSSPCSAAYISTLVKQLGLEDEDLQRLVQLVKSPL